jgi:hypothetical protein
MISDVPYIHRQNPDCTYDSICLTCFLTAARGRSEAELRDGEKNHNCWGAIQAECFPKELQEAS